MKSQSSREMLLGSTDNTERAGPEGTEEGLLPPPPSWKEI